MILFGFKERLVEQLFGLTLVILLFKRSLATSDDLRREITSDVITHVSVYWFTYCLVSISNT